MMSPTCIADACRSIGWLASHQLFNAMNRKVPMKTARAVAHRCFPLRQSIKRFCSSSQLGTCIFAKRILTQCLQCVALRISLCDQKTIFGHPRGLSSLYSLSHLNATLTRSRTRRPEAAARLRQDTPQCKSATTISLFNRRRIEKSVESIALLDQLNFILWACICSTFNQHLGRSWCIGVFWWRASDQ
jgi:hypothetical protein